MREYRALYDNIGVQYQDHGAVIDIDLFKAGCMIVAFDLSPDACNGFHNHIHKTGTIDLELLFHQPLPSTIVVHILATYNALLTIQPNKECRVQL